MTYLVRFHIEAESEMNEAVDYLNGESPGLGEIFLNDIQHAIDLITSYPEIAPVIKGRVRRKLLRKFPYSLIYSVKGEEIRILAVMHQHGRPFHWRRRAPD
jgi:plasmid stabilization system protein ParE